MRCPHCDQSIARTDRFCRHCGRAVSPPPQPPEPAPLSRASYMPTMAQSTGDLWGARLNLHGAGLLTPGSRPVGCPEWVERGDWYRWDHHGLVVWDHVGRGIGVIPAGQALSLLEQAQSGEGWNAEGIPIAEYGVVFRLPTLRRARRNKGQPEPPPEEHDSEGEEHWDERLRLRGEAAREFVEFLRRNEPALRAAADKDQEKVHEAVRMYWGMAFRHHFAEQLRAIDLSRRPLPWTKTDDPPTLECRMPDYMARIVVAKSGFWWQPTLEEAGEFPWHGPHCMELDKALDWAETELPRRRAEEEARMRAAVEEKAAEAARLASLPRKDLAPYWIAPEALEPARITYRAVLQVEYVPYHAKKLEIAPGRFIDYDKEFYTPSMLARELGLDSAHVTADQPIDLLGWYFLRSATTYLQPDVAASQAQQLWNQGVVLQRFQEGKAIRARYGTEEVETRLHTWLGLCEPTDRPWGPSQSRADYMAGLAMRETLIAALDVNGWRLFLEFEFRERSDAQLLRDMHRMRVKSRHQTQAARAESDRWLRENP
jgi:hypothetical protein